MPPPEPRTLCNSVFPPSPAAWLQRTGVIAVPVRLLEPGLAFAQALLVRPWVLLQHFLHLLAGLGHIVQSLSVLRNFDSQLGDKLVD